MKYNVSIAIDGRFSIIVNAANPEEAKAKAEEAFLACDINIGEIECVGTHAVNCTDENDRITDY